MKDFSMKLELRIDWSELDAFGHVNNLSVMKYVQSARVNYMEALGLMQSQAEKGIGPILASTDCQFRKVLFYPGQVTVYSRVEYIKNTSLKIQHSVFNDNNELTAEAQDIVVYYDFRKNTKSVIPKDVREKIEKVEGRTFS